VNGPLVIPAEVRARLAPLRIAPRRAIAQGGFGLHASRHRGAGLEFAQYRAYEPGDEPRRIDWKLYARSDRYVVREAERDAALALWLVVDATASMAQADQSRPDRSKLAAAALIATCAFEVAARQGDRFGLLVVSDGRVEPLALGSGPRHRDRCSAVLAQRRASGAWPDEAGLRVAWDLVAPDALVLFVGDGFDDAQLALAERLAATRREVLDVQVLGADERDFPFTGGHRFHDPETGAELELDAPAARAAFLARFADARATRTRRLAAAGVRSVEHFLDEAPDAPLRRLFAREAGAR
jgi:uncharacterized protein (DUF58 family)